MAKKGQKSVFIDIPLDFKDLFEFMIKSTADSIFFKDRECRFFM